MNARYYIMTRSDCNKMRMKHNGNQSLTQKLDTTEIEKLKYITNIIYFYSRPTLSKTGICERCSFNINISNKANYKFIFLIACNQTL